MRNELDDDADRPWDWQDKVVIWGCAVVCVVLALLLIEGAVK